MLPTPRTAHFAGSNATTPNGPPLGEALRRRSGSTMRVAQRQVRCVVAIVPTVLGEMLQGKDRGPRLDGSHDDRVQADPPGCSEHSLIAIVASSVIASGGR